MIWLPDLKRDPSARSERSKRPLEEVSVNRARLVHWDIWAGNIFTDGEHDWNHRLGEACGAIRCWKWDSGHSAATENFMAGYGKRMLTETENAGRVGDIYMAVLQTLNEYRRYETMEMYERGTGIAAEADESCEGVSGNFVMNPYIRKRKT